MVFGFIFVTFRSLKFPREHHVGNIGIILVTMIPTINLYVNKVNDEPRNFFFQYAFFALWTISVLLIIVQFTLIFKNRKSNKK